MTADVYLPINVTTHRIKAADVPKLLSDVEECSKGLRGFSGYNIDFVQESKSVSSWLVCPNVPVSCYSPTYCGISIFIFIFLFFFGGGVVVLAGGVTDYFLGLW